MGEIIVPNAVVRKPNHIYYIDSQGNLCEAEMARGRTKDSLGKKKKKKSTKKSKK
jgi:hypothetical protein